MIAAPFAIAALFALIGVGLRVLVWLERWST
jgi:hypothetical protein